MDSFRSLIICVMLLSNNSIPRLAPRITKRATKKSLISCSPLCQTFPRKDSWSRDLFLMPSHKVSWLWCYQVQSIRSRKVLTWVCDCVRKTSFSVEGKVCINNKIDHVVSCINIVTIAEPIDTIISREHSVKHEVLKVGQVLSWEEVCFVHEPIIGTRVGGLGFALCHLVNWFYTSLSSNKCG